ncbi:NAD(P)H-dependent oxidoreductase [Stenomitos frigidus]|nr:NAD(P)H-dependent oxidoreductase [Stenomitos frigidus]
MTAAKILAFAGSACKDSFNKKLVKIAIAGAKAEGAEVSLSGIR